MKALEKITLRNIRMNRKRTWVTIIGIMLATALIVVVADMAASFRASMVEYEKVNSGDYHYCFHAVAPENLKYFRENRNIDRMGLITDVGYTQLDGATNKEKPYLFLKAMDDQAMEVANVTVLEGRLPENDHEVILSEGIRLGGDADYAIGLFCIWRIRSVTVKTEESWIRPVITWMEKNWKTESMRRETIQ